MWENMHSFKSTTQIEVDSIFAVGLLGQLEYSTLHGACRHLEIKLMIATYLHATDEK